MNPEARPSSVDAPWCAMRFPVGAQLKDGTQIQLDLAGQENIEAVRELFHVVIEEGTSYPHDRLPEQEEFMEYWFRGKSTVAAYLLDRARHPGLLGCFYLRPNWPGRARHVANAGFMVAPAWRNKGLGWLLGAVMLDYARDLGYRSVIFNLVFAENQIARRLWEKLGFTELAVIPEAVRTGEQSYQEAVIMFRSLSTRQ